MRISDWSSDVCSSDLRPLPPARRRGTRSALPAQCASAPDPRDRPRRSRSNPPGHHAMNHTVLIAAIGLLSTTTVFAQTVSAPLIVVEDRGGDSALPYYPSLNPQPTQATPPDHMPRPDKTPVGTEDVST